MPQKPAIATMSSHSSLFNIIPGAIEEDLEVYAVITERDWPLWSQYSELLENISILKVGNTSETKAIIKQFNSIDEEYIIIPHGSFVRYLSSEDLDRLQAPLLGGTKILKYEANRVKNTSLLDKSDILTPKIYNDPEEIDRPVMVKLHGAEGGRGYFIASDKEDYKIKSKGKTVDFIQEYVSGVSIYAHYFNSPMKKRCELLGFDRRLESNVNAQYLFTSADPTFTVVGNVPIVVRESLVPEYQRIGENFAKTTGIVGPFCIETICTSDLKIYAFEFSGRIVAGTTVWVPFGNTYANTLWQEPMYMGKRIAREISLAHQQNAIETILIDSPNI
jgi:5-formaminoimidazole-4-carboxamide-1-(beta)-D-ribofuranosyl 5'-monophosphate synthetase